jgi:hypothetical protein
LNYSGPEEDEEDEDKDAVKATLEKLVKDVEQLSFVVAKLYDHSGLNESE